MKLRTLNQIVFKIPIWKIIISIKDLKICKPHVISLLVLWGVERNHDRSKVQLISTRRSFKLYCFCRKRQESRECPSLRYVHSYLRPDDGKELQPPMTIPGGAPSSPTGTRHWSLTCRLQCTQRRIDRVFKDRCTWTTSGQILLPYFRRRHILLFHWYLLSTNFRGFCWLDPRNSIFIEVKKK